MKNKRILFFIILIVSMMLFASFIMTYASGENTNYILGDVDRDGEITATDYLKIKKTFLNEYALEGTSFALADVDFDERITSTDYLKIKSAMLSGEAIDDSGWNKFEGKKKIQYCSSPSVFSPYYYANMLGYEDVYSTPDTTGEYSEDNNVAEHYSYDPYSGIYIIVESPFEHPKTITESFPNGQTVTLNYNNFKAFPNGEYQHTYYFYQKATDTTPSTSYYAYTDKSGNVIGKRFVNFKNTESDKAPLTEKEIISLANSKKDELGFSDFKLSSVNVGSKIYTINFENKINGLKTPDYLILGYDKYGVLTEYKSNAGNSEEYDLRGFDSISDKDEYYNILKEKGDYLLKNYQCECLSSKNPNDYIFSFEITEYFISYDGKMCAKASVLYDSIDESKSHDHTFGIYFYVAKELNKSSNDVQSSENQLDFSNEYSFSGFETITEAEPYKTFLNEEKIDTPSIVYSYNGENVYNGETKVGIPFLALVNEFGAKTEWLNKNEVEITLETNEKNIINISEKQFGIPLAPGSSYGIREIINGEIYMDPSTVGICLKGFFNLDYTPHTEIYAENKTVTVKTQS